VGWKGGEAEDGNGGPLSIACKGEASGKSVLWKQEIQSRHHIMSDVSENTGYVGLYSRATVLSDIKQSQNTSGPSLS